MGSRYVEIVEHQLRKKNLTELSNTLATVFEGVLFIFASIKAMRTIFSRMKGGVHTNGMLFTLIVNDNILYFLGYGRFPIRITELA